MCQRTWRPVEASVSWIFTFTGWHLRESRYTILLQTSSIQDLSNYRAKCLLHQLMHERQAQDVAVEEFGSQLFPNINLFISCKVNSLKDMYLRGPLVGIVPNAVSTSSLQFLNFLSRCELIPPCGSSVHMRLSPSDLIAHFLGPFHWIGSAKSSIRIND